MPPAWRVENDNVLRQVEGLASGEAGRKLWDETADSIALRNLRENTLGDWELTLRAGSSAAEDAAGRAGAVVMSNRYFGSKLLLGADGTLVWLSNSLANKAVVLFARISIILLAAWCQACPCRVVHRDALAASTAHLNSTTPTR